MKIETLENVIKDSLKEFASVIDKWKLREREAIAVFVMDHFLKAAQNKNLIQKNSQIQIETAVPQIPDWGNNPKKTVCKDLVIWEDPFSTCWDERRKASRFPISILEWKTKVRDFDKKDLDWMKRFSLQKEAKGFVGYVIALDFEKRNFLFKAAQVVNGEIDLNWLEIK